METEAMSTKSVGQLLREARLAKGISLEQVEADTNIKATALKCLENEEYDKTPGDFFVKGAIRSYGNYLGLNGPELVTMYKASKEGISLREAESKGIREATRVSMRVQLKDKRDIGSGTGKIDLASFAPSNIPWMQIGMGVGCLALIGALYFAVPRVISWHSSRTASVAPTTITTNVPTEKVAEKAPVTDKLMLELEAGGSCWLEISTDGKTVLEKTVVNGDKLSFEAQEKIVIKYGNVGVMKVLINGKDLSTPNEHGVATRVYTKDSLQQQELNQKTEKSSPEAIPTVKDNAAEAGQVQTTTAPEVKSTLPAEKAVSGGEKSESVQVTKETKPEASAPQAEVKNESTVKATPEKQEPAPEKKKKQSKKAE